MTQKQFLNQTHLPQKLCKAVIAQLHGWESFKETAPDITRHGIDGGYGKFVYFSDTVPFAHKNRNEIIKVLEEMAQDCGEDVVAMVCNFGVFRQNKADQDDKRDLYRFLSGTNCKETTIPNLMAWYAAEEVCRSFDDLNTEL